jgi:hypothetical protein
MPPAQPMPLNTPRLFCSPSRPSRIAAARCIRVANGMRQLAPDDPDDLQPVPHADATERLNAPGMFGSTPLDQAELRLSRPVSIADRVPQLTVDDPHRKDDRHKTFSQEQVICRLSQERPPHATA